MARRRGIFGRRRGRGEDETSLPPPPPELGDEPDSESIPIPDAEASGETGDRPAAGEAHPVTEDWALITDERELRPPAPVTGGEARAEATEEDPPEADQPDGSVTDEPDDVKSGTGDADEPVVATEPPAGRQGDTGERIKIAADQAAQEAEMRAMDEILALEEDLEQAKSAAAGRVDELDHRLREADERAERAEERAQELARERDEIEARTREAATKWLRKQVTNLRAEARERVRSEVERVRAETEAEVRAESEQRLQEQAARLRDEADRTAATPEQGAAEGDAATVARAVADRDEASAALSEIGTRQARR